MQFAEKWEGKKPGAAATVPIVLPELQILNRFFSLPKSVLRNSISVVMNPGRPHVVRDADKNCLDLLNLAIPNFE